MGREAGPLTGVDVPRVTAAVWEQMAASRRLLERLGAIRCASPAPDAVPVPTPPAVCEPITVAAGWGREPPPPSGGRAPR